MSLSLILIGLAVSAMFFASTASFVKDRTLWRLLQLLGSICLVVVVLTHVAEAFQMFPSMGWGRPNTAGHYLDLGSAILGVTLFSTGFLTTMLSRRKNPK